ncbi:hypothetical protein QBC35DRAFT_448095 [Podospora australis]|uniref:DUF6546 domain-containing protein n=1 Tax=Podospora australis TaxID=1536484 RepID=A0AAN7ALU0_9PEZI|nr:hypothetical protein QBC35DRAFT_448095 [Podospora australis]
MPASRKRRRSEPGPSDRVLRSTAKKRRAEIASANSFLDMTVAIKLFSVLSAWQPRGRLVLELNASSPSDSEHWFKDHTQNDEDDCIHDPASTRRHDDPDHGWDKGRQVKPPPAMAITRVFPLLCEGVFGPRSIARVCAITGLVIRRQLRYRVDLGLLHSMCKKLPRLENLAYEPRLNGYIQDMPEVDDPEHVTRAEDMSKILPNIKTLRTVSIFEDFNQQFALALHNAETGILRDLVIVNPVPNKLLAQAFIATGHGLEHLSIAFIFDAGDFFDSLLRLPEWLNNGTPFLQDDSVLQFPTWPHLQSLTLTSSTLTQTTLPEKISKLLRSASSVALKIPKLQSMVLWFGKVGEACAVTFRRNKAARKASLTWRGTWHFTFTEDVIESWLKVTFDRDLGYPYLTVKHERIRGVDVRCLGDAIYHLRLPERVIHPVSL